MSQKSERVSVHILICNRAAEIAICLSSLLQQTYKEWDLILIDDSESSMLSQKWFRDLITRIKAEGHGLIYEVQPIHGNIGVNRNLAVSKDKFMNEIIIRIDDDSFIDKDYIKKLVKLYEDKVNEGFKVGAIGGIVPTFGAPTIYKKTPKIFNEIVFDDEGNIIKLGDDGGLSYKPNKILPTHHLRSSFLFTRSSHEAVNGHPLEYGWTGFREETDLSLKWLWAGYTLWTDTSAICWHLRGGGGAHNQPSQVYQQTIKNNDAHFRTKVRYWYQIKGSPI